MRNVSLSGLARRALLAVLALALAKGSMAQDSGRLQPRADPAVEAAVEAARRTPVPDYAALQQSSDIKDVVQEVTGDTTALEALRQDGQGALFAPGRAEADRCHSQGDPTCLAVQVVDRTSTTRPVIDPDVAGDLIGGRDEVAGSAEDWVQVDGTGSAGSCRPNISTIVKPSETKTCDVRLWVESTSETHACMTAWESILEEASEWICRIVEKKNFSTVCSVPVVVPQETTSTVACWEGVKEAARETCPVTVTAEVRRKHLAACVRPKFRTVTRQCSRRLVVKPSGTCRVGEVTEASNANYAELGEDVVPGADTLSVSVECREQTDGRLPTITMATNAAAGAEPSISASTSEPVFDVPVALQSTSLKTTACPRRGTATS